MADTQMIALLLQKLDMVRESQRDQLEIQRDQLELQRIQGETLRRLQALAEGQISTTANHPWHPQPLAAEKPRKSLFRIKTFSPFWQSIAAGAVLWGVGICSRAYLSRGGDPVLLIETLLKLLKLL